jgi:hypothetical protein
MKNIAVLFCVSLVFLACKIDKVSMKGSWTSSDKEKARKEVEKDSSTLELVKTKKNVLIVI